MQRDYERWAWPHPQGVMCWAWTGDSFSEHAHSKSSGHPSNCKPWPSCSVLRLKYPPRAPSESQGDKSLKVSSSTISRTPSKSYEFRHSPPPHAPQALWKVPVSEPASIAKLPSVRTTQFCFHGSNSGYGTVGLSCQWMARTSRLCRHTLSDTELDPT